MFWLLFLALMILVPLLAGVHAWHSVRQQATVVTRAALPSQRQHSTDSFSLPGSPRL